MRDPLNYEPLPYTEAAILISPTPAARLPATRHVDEWRYEESHDCQSLIAMAKRMTLYGRSLTDCHLAGTDPLHDFLENMARAGRGGRDLAEKIFENASVPRRCTSRPRQTPISPVPTTNQIKVYFPSTPAEAEAFYEGIRAGVEERRRMEAT